MLSTNAWSREINYWSDRYIKLQDDAAAGKDTRLNLENVRRTIDDLTARRESREKELKAMRHVISGNARCGWWIAGNPDGIAFAKTWRNGLDG